VVIKAYADAESAAAHALSLVACALAASRRATADVVFDFDDTLSPTGTATAESCLVAGRLCRRLMDLGLRAHIVTARTKDMEEDTMRELAGILGPRRVTSSAFAPKSFQSQGTALSAWKASARLDVAKRHGGCVLLTVGDAFTDIAESERGRYDDMLAALGGDRLPAFRVVRCRSAHTVWGLKLAENLVD
jgi:hypothetical protein